MHPAKATGRPRVNVEGSMSPAAKAGTIVPPAAIPNVLVVDDEPSLVELLCDVVRSIDCNVLTARTAAEARRVIARHDVQVLVADVNLPDGDGTSLVGTLRKRNPSAAAVIITGDPSVASATAALRGGAVDFVAKPFDARQILTHVRDALAAHGRADQADRKLRKLKTAVRKLNDARKTISQKVDILCNDLVSAYGELSKQLDVVRVQEGFRKTIADAADLEQLICQAMDWMMRQTGYSNVAVWLVGEDGKYQLGAYMKYTIPGDDAVGEALRRVVVPLAARDGRDAPVKFSAADLAPKLSAAERELLKDQQFLAIDCTYLGESLAAMAFFRDAQVPFGEQDVETLRAISPIFAQALAAIVRQGEGEEEHGEPTGSDEARDADDRDPPNGGNTADPKSRKARKPDPADWWKRGEAPPF